MFNKILIANRGEIACRVIKTARKMGIQSVAVYADAERDARHVELADSALCIGGAAAKDSYLCGDKIIAACHASGAEALHPGYGFLSENEDFARAVEAAGIVFIGPKAHAIAAMGDKIAAKKLAAQAGVNTIPGYNDAIASAEQAVEIARGIGFPVMIKASAGGGGKGLRVAWNEAEAHEGFTACGKEALSAFGDARVFIEKFIEAPRHIEIQVLGDAYGKLVHLGERECSIQRRHQKLIEEAPSPFVTDALREAMGAQALALAGAVQYQSAGTVEFVVGRQRDFYFLEMNTRLQVEHPVTECITGIDLVEQMIRIAAGEPLAFAQEEIPRRGWALECRINAEDPHRGFLPSSGRLLKYCPPREVAGAVRVDTGVYEGGEVSLHYDSMIAKLITHADSRAEAIDRMQAALDAFVIRGVACSIPLQAALLRHPRFVAGDFSTAFLSEVYPKGFHAVQGSEDEILRLAALAAALYWRSDLREAQISGQLPGHPRVLSGRYVVLLRDQRVDCAVQPQVRQAASTTGQCVTIGGRCHTVEGEWVFGAPRFEGRVDRAPMVVQLERHGAVWRIWHGGISIDARVYTPRAADLLSLMPRKAPPDRSKYLVSPMPGLLTQMAVSVGQALKAGERLATIEAMKMENVLRAEQDCVVAEVLATVGESLAVDQAILRFR